MDNRKTLLSLCGLIAFAVYAGAAWAGIAGHVQFVNGEVRLINTAGQASELRKGDAINDGRHR